MFSYYISIVFTVLPEVNSAAYTMIWHSKTLDELIQYFNLDTTNGLSSGQVEDHRARFGKNEFQSVKQKSALILLLQQFNDPVIYILIVAAILNSIVAEPKDSIVIGVVIILNTIIGFVQEIKAADAIKALMEMYAPSARVLRDGRQMTIPTKEVVCGDIILLESGACVPADSRLIEDHNLIVDESMLTGESFAITKKSDAIVEEDAELGDRLTMVYSGTIVQKGRGVAVVTGVGPSTEFGKISQKVVEAEDTVSPLQKNIESFSKALSITILLAVVAIFIVGYLRGNTWIDMLLTSVGLAVSAIPEGLPVAVTITLSIGLNQMAKRKAIVKKLAAVETLGSTNVICTDKTGTLTKNQMTVTGLFAGGTEYKVSGSGYAKSGEITEIETGNQMSSNDCKTLDLFAFIGNYCTESSISDGGEDWNMTGDPTEVALMILAKKLNYQSNNWATNVDIPFESEIKLMAVSARDNDGDNDNNYILAKGAAEAIIERCSSMAGPDGDTIDLDEDLILGKVSEFSGKGLRVLALAYADKPDSDIIELENLKGLTFVGIAGIEDAVREEAVDAVADCHSAGVRVVMITGDHVQTASSIAESIGIAGKREITAIRGRELEKLSDEELFERVPDIDVYARVAPHHKFRIVQQLQRHNKTVAMTGDGVNDAPALKQADIGIAMGTGTDVAKEAAHIVLMDDNFASIVRAIRRGRIILNNLKHILLYILSTSSGGLLTIAMSVAVGYPLPILPAQLLWINLVTDGTSTFPLGFEKEHGDVMRFRPRSKDEPLVSRPYIYRIALAGIMMMIGTLAVFHYSAADIFNPTPDELAKARTMAFCTLAFFQIWNVQNSRSLGRSLFFNLPYDGKETFDRIGPMKNPILLAVMLLAVLLQVSAVALPVMNNLLNTVPLNLNDWLVIMSVSFSIIIVVELTKVAISVTGLIFNRRNSRIINTQD